MVATGRPGDRERTFGVPVRVAEAVEEQLGGGQVHGDRVREPAELVVGQAVDQRRRLRARHRGLADRAAVRRGEGGSCARAGQECAVAERACRGERASRPLVQRAELQPVDPVAGQLHEQGHRLGRRAAGQVVQRGHEPAVRGVVVAEDVLDAGAVGGEPHAGGSVGRARSEGDQVEATQQRGVGRDEVSAGVFGTGECGPQAETLGRRRAVGEEVQRRPEPAGRPGGCARRQRLAGLPQHGDGAPVARPRGLRDVVRAPGRRCPARAESVGDAFVRSEPPSAGGGLVDGAADERVAEAEAARYRRGSDEVAPQQLVQRGGHRRLGQVRGGRGELGDERIAGDGRALQSAPRGRVEQRQLAGERGGDRLRDRGVEPVVHRVRGPRGRPGELFQIEGVAAALGVQRVAGPLRPDQLTGLVRGQRTQFQPGRPGPLERPGQPLGHLPRPHGDREKHRRGRRPAQQGPDQVDGPRVGPVQVVEQEDERRPGREHLQAPADGPLGPVALVLVARRGDGPR